MTALAIFLGVIVGIIIFFGVGFLIIWNKFKKSAKKHGLGDIKLNEVVDEVARIKEENSNTPRTLPGITKLLMPQIISDFSDFNENLIYNKTEKCLRGVFESLSQNKITNLDEFPIIEDKVRNIVEDNISNNIQVNYKDINFHGFTIEDYKKYGGVATVTVGVAVEYYYEKIINNSKKYDSRYKEQARYSCKFIYIYDETNLDDAYLEKVIGLNCPNCGAAIKSYGNPVCEYCGTALKIMKDINVKAWAFSSYIKK